MNYSNYEPSLYMPFTWDAVWSIANGLHSLVYEKNAIANASILINNKNERQQLYEELVNHVEFVGATGIVDFLNEAVTNNISMATRKASQVCLDFFVGELPELMGGSSDLTPSNNTFALRNYEQHIQMHGKLRKNN